MKCLGKPIPKPPTFSSSGKYQLITRMLQVSHVLGELTLIPIFVTHFLQAQSTKSNFLMGPIHVLYYFILLSMAQAHATYLRNLRECDLEGMSWFVSDLLHESNPCVLPSRQGTLIAPLAHGGDFVLEISTLKELLCFGWLWYNFFALPFFDLKHIADPKWLTLFVATTRCRLQGPAMSRKHQPMNLGHFISQIMQKASQPSYPLKANLTITFLIETLELESSSIDQ